jgi:hypothetical protein
MNKEIKLQKGQVEWETLKITYYLNRYHGRGTIEVKVPKECSEQERVMYIMSAITKTITYEIN